MTKRIWSPPQLFSAVFARPEKRKVGWLELFYDLIYVAAIIQLGNVLSKDVSWLGAGKFTFLFVLVWWAWTGTMFYYNRFVTDDALHRLIIFAQMFAVGNMAVFASTAFKEGAIPFALSYMAARLMLVALYARASAHNEQARPLINRYIGGFSIGAALWFMSIFVPSPFRFVLWFLALAVEFYTPLSKGSRQHYSLLPPDPHHMMERFALITIIVLGESFIKSLDALVGHNITATAYLFGTVAFFLVMSIWWVYFDDIAETHIRKTALAPFIFIYTHLPLALGITALGVATKKLVLIEAGEMMADKYRILICGALILVFLAIALIDSATESSSPQGRYRVPARVISVFALLAIALFAGNLSATTTAMLIGLVCIFQVVFEVFVVDQGTL